MMKKKVCHVIGGIVGGGIEQVIINYCSKIKTVDFDLLYQYEPNNTCLKKIENAGVRCVRIPDKIKHPFRHCIAIYSFLKKGQYDAVHVHLDWYLSWIICFIALLAGVKKRIIHHHQIYQEKTLLHRIVFFLMRKMNVLLSTHRLACSNGAAINGFGKNAFEKGLVSVIQNAVDIEHFRFNLKKRTEFRQRYRMDDKICIGCVGRLCLQKNQVFLLKTFKLMLEHNANYLLLLIGDGPDKKKIDRIVQELKIEENVMFLNPQGDVAPFYSAMDIFCLPSLWEGLGMVLVEAQINGLPCFASDKVPPSVRISDSITFLSIDNPVIWANAVMKMGSHTHNNLADVTNFNINERFGDLEQIYLE